VISIIQESALSLASLEMLELISPDEVVDWASERVAYSDSPNLLALSLLAKPTSRVEVDSLLLNLLAEFGVDSFDERSAGLRIARRLAQEIVDGVVEPAVGARKIWWDVVRRVPTLEPQLRSFVGLASEWEDQVSHRAGYEADIIRAARRFLISNG
jgi:hypothetical protein